MAGLYFTTTGLFRSGYKPLHDDQTYDPFWREAERLDLPVFWVQFGTSPVGSYADEMLCLERIIERFPTLRHVLVHGVPTALYADEKDRVTLPDIVVQLMRTGQVTRSCSTRSPGAAGRTIPTRAPSISTSSSTALAPTASSGGPTCRTSNGTAPTGSP